MTQQDVHYSISRSAGILGLGTANIIRIPVDERRKMQVAALAEALRECQRQSRPVIAVVAGACATPIGAFDPLEEIADLCREFHVWLHVDAAHGGATLLSDRHRHLVAGLERADSVVWDAHKMLFMPALCAFVFYRQAEHQFEAFHQEAPYLFDPTDPGMAEYDSGTRTLECTKRAAAYGLWGTWSLLGRQLFGDLVDVTFALTQQLHQMLQAAPDFVPLHEPECNIQVFQFVPPEIAHWLPERLGAFQLELRRSVTTSGDAYFVPAKLNGVGVLRMTLINPLTTQRDLEQVLDTIREHGRRILESPSRASR